METTGLLLVGLGDISAIIQIHGRLSRGIDDIGYCLVLGHEPVMLAAIGTQEVGFAIWGISSNMPDDLAQSGCWETGDVIFWNRDWGCLLLCYLDS